MPEYKGGCHCGNIAITLTTPEESPKPTLNACQCSFCRKHGARTYSNRSAKVVLDNEDADSMYLSYYEFGMETAGALLCGHCGVYVCMLLVDWMNEGSDFWNGWTTVNVNCLDDQEAWAGLEVQAKIYDEEDYEARIERRKKNWCPTTLHGFRRETLHG
jgi:hypothetical protein